MGSTMKECRPIFAGVCHFGCIFCPQIREHLFANRPEGPMENKREAKMRGSFWEANRQKVQSSRRKMATSQQYGTQIAVWGPWVDTNSRTGWIFFCTLGLNERRNELLLEGGWKKNRVIQLNIDHPDLGKRSIEYNFQLQWQIARYWVFRSPSSLSFMVN